MSNITKENVIFSDDQTNIEKILLRNRDLDLFFDNKLINPFITKKSFVEDDFFEKYISRHQALFNISYQKKQTFEDILDNTEIDDNDMILQMGETKNDLIQPILPDKNVSILEYKSSDTSEDEDEDEDDNKEDEDDEEDEEDEDDDNIDQNIITTSYKNSKIKNLKSKYEMDCKAVEQTIKDIEFAIKNISSSTQRKAIIIKFCEEKNVNIDIKIFDMVKKDGTKFITEDMLIEWCDAIEINNQKEVFDFGSLLLDTLFGLLENLSSNEHIVKKLGFNILEGIGEEIKNTNILNTSKIFINQKIIENTGQAAIFLELVFLIGNKIRKNIFKPMT